MQGQYMNVFDSFWASGDAIAQGKNPYMLLPEVIVTKKLHLTEINLNPPALLPFFRFFALLEPWKGACAWLVISAALFILPALALLKQIGGHMQNRQVVWLFFTPHLLNVLGAEQIYTSMFALSVYAWIAFKKDRQVLAGILIGILAAMKPPFILWPAYLFLARHFRIAVVAGVVAALLSLLPVILYGPRIYAEWLGAVSLDRHGMTFPQEISLNGFFRRAGFQPAGMALSALLLLASAAVVWVKKPDVFNTTAVAIPVAMLCSPLAWIEYVLILFPTILAVRWDKKMTVIAILLSVPAAAGIPGIGGAAWVATLCGLIFLLPILMLATEYIMRLYRPASAAQPA
jgi:arabinofuranan 3-O-arabinosyltransferase